MTRDELTIGQKVLYRGEVVTVVEITRQRVFIDDGGSLPDVVSARSLRPYVEAERQAEEPAGDFVLEYVPHDIRGEMLAIGQEAGSDATPARWGVLDYVAAAAGLVAWVGLHGLIATIV